MGVIEIIPFSLLDWKLLALITTTLAIYYYYTSTFDYFEKKGIPFLKPTIFLGNLGPRLRATTSFHESEFKIYNTFKGNPYGGKFEGRKPILYVLNPEIIKAVTIRDFDYFVDRNLLNTKAPRYLTRSLLNLKGSEWKGVRSVLTPTFSSARLKSMMPIIQQCSERLVKYLEQYDRDNVELKDAMGHFTLEVIGTCAFGIRSDVLSDKNAEFYKAAKSYDSISPLKKTLTFFLILLLPKAIKYLNISFFNTKSTEYLIDILKAAKTERRSRGVKSYDFLQLLLDAAEKENNNSETTKFLDDDTIDAQAFLFLLAGYETSSTLLSFAIHVLATHPDIQNKLREHIEEVTNGKDVDSELLIQLPYLEGFLLETLRMYSPVARVDRTCTKPYTLPGTKVHINPGDVLAIPIVGIHMDPDIYPNPKEFQPERFMRKEKTQLFLGFGAGPRNCIGLRFAMLTTKLAMITLIKNFKFSVCPKTQDPVQLHKRSTFLKPETGLWIRVEKL